MAIVIDTRMVNASGIGRYIRNTLPYIIKYFNDKKIYLLGRTNELKNYNLNRYRHVRIVNFSHPVFSFKGYYFNPHKLIPSDDIDFFWSPHYNIPYFYNEKLIVTIHDVNHLALPCKIFEIHKKICSFYMLKKACLRATEIITVSNFSKNEIEYHLGKRPQEIQVIHNGVEKKWFHIQKKHRPYNHRYFIFVGNLKPHKNVLALLQAFQLIYKKIPHHLVIVGKKDGFFTKDTQSETFSKFFGDRVHFTGFIDDNRLEQYIVHAEAMIFPSLYEGFGLPPLEAMAAGCPVLCSNAACLPEIYEESALFFDPNSPSNIAEKIMIFINNKILSDEYKIRGICQANKFTWEKCAQETISVMESVLARHE